MTSSPSPFANAGKLQVLPTSVSGIHTDRLLSRWSIVPIRRTHCYSLNPWTTTWEITCSTFVNQQHRLERFCNNRWPVAWWPRRQVSFAWINLKQCNRIILHKIKVNTHLKHFGRTACHNPHSINSRFRKLLNNPRSFILRLLKMVGNRRFDVHWTTGVRFFLHFCSSRTDCPGSTTASAPAATTTTTTAAAATTLSTAATADFNITSESCHSTRCSSNRRSATEHSLYRISDQWFCIEMSDVSHYVTSTRWKASTREITHGSIVHPRALGRG